MSRFRSPIPQLVAGVAAAVVVHLSLLSAAAAYLDRLGAPGAVNLGVRWIERPADDVEPRGTLTGAVRVERAGPAAGGVGVSWVLSRDRMSDGDDTVLAESSGSTEGETVATRRLAVKVPGDADGPWFVLAVVDPDGRVSELDERDNTAAARVWIDAGRTAAMEVVGLTAPDRVPAGGTFVAEFDVKNMGPGWARPGWTDRVTLRPLGDGAALTPLLEVRRARVLAPQATAGLSRVELSVPLGLDPGDYELAVSPDRSGASGATRRVRVEAADRPDLVVTEVDWPAQVTPGRPSELSFTVANRSPAPTNDTLWADRVYLSADNVLDPSDTVLLSQPRLVPLPGNGRYRVTGHRLTLTPEQLTSSRMHLILSTDDEAGIEEYDETNNLAVQAFVVRAEAEPREEEEVELGRDDEPERLTVAWIAHDDFQDLLARQSVTHQPAVQAQADPTPGAPLEPEPDGAAATPPPAAPPLTSPVPPSITEAPATPDAADPKPTGETPDPAPAPPQTPPSNNPPVPKVSTAAAPADPQPPSPQAPNTQNPTSTPRSDREAPPTLTIDAETVRPGQVLVGPGLEVRTKHPKFGAVARNIAIPTNPMALITFRPDGKVTTAELATSSGYESVDSELLTSLYSWEATGRALEQRKEPFQIKIRILLVDEPAKGKE